MATAKKRTKQGAARRAAPTPRAGSKGVVRQAAPAPAPQTPADPAGPRVPVLPLRDVVFFPSVVMPLLIGRQTSLQAVEASNRMAVAVRLAARRGVGRFIRMGPSRGGVLPWSSSARDTFKAE